METLNMITEIKFKKKGEKNKSFKPWNNKFG